MKKVLIILDYNRMFRGNLPTNESLSIEMMISLFESKGYEVEVTNFDNIVNGDISKYNDYYIIYTSSQNRIYKQYVDDILFALSKTNYLIPRYEIFKAHENKGYQEIVKKELDIRSNNGMVLCSYNDLEKNINNIKFPTVLKSINGAGSKGVLKIDNKDQLLKIFDELSFKHKGRWFNLKRNIKKKFNIKYNRNWYGMNVDNCYVVLQDFIPELDGDWKVLVFDGKYYTLKRGIRKNDFRASGSGILDFDVEIPHEILNFAEGLYGKLNVPFISLDIAMDRDSQCHLIEFQGVHFGPKTLTASKGYYIKKNSKWTRIKKKSVLEEEYVSAYDKFIRKAGGKK